MKNVIFKNSKFSKLNCVDLPETNFYVNMNYSLKQEGKFKYVEIGEGQPIIILHGLMGGLSNFDGVAAFFSKNGYMVVLPELPLYSLSLLKTNVKSLITRYKTT